MASPPASTLMRSMPAYCPAGSGNSGCIKSPGIRGTPSRSASAGVPDRHANSDGEGAHHPAEQWQGAGSASALFDEAGRSCGTLSAAGEPAAGGRSEIAVLGHCAQRHVWMANLPNGTGYKMFHTAPYQIAAKSGTSQVFSLKQNQTYNAKMIPVRLRDHIFIPCLPLISIRRWRWR